MIANQRYFPGGQPTRKVNLAAMGFEVSGALDGDFKAADVGHLGGGIQSPRMVTIPRGAHLLRLYMNRTASPGTQAREDFGDWWFTPHEYRRLCAYFGLDVAGGDMLSSGTRDAAGKPATGTARADGRSALHGALALLKEWYVDRQAGDTTPSRMQLAHFHLVRTVTEIHAMYGHGNVAQTSDYSHVLKPIKLDGNTTARQLFIPSPWSYRDAFAVLSQPDNDTDSELHRIVASLPAQTLPFERR